MSLNFEKIISRLPVAILIFDGNSSLIYFNEAVTLLPEFINISKLKKNEKVDKIIPLLSQKIDFPLEMPSEIQLNNYLKLNGKPTSIVAKIFPLYENENFDGFIVLVEDLVLFNELAEVEIVKTKIFSEIFLQLSFNFALIDSQFKIYYKSIYFDESILKSIKFDFADLLQEVKEFTTEGRTFEIRVVSLNENSVVPRLYFILIKDISEEIRNIKRLEQNIENLNLLVERVNRYIIYDKKGKIKENGFAKELKNVFQISDAIEKNKFFEVGGNFIFQYGAGKEKSFFNAKVLDYYGNYYLSIVPCPEETNKQLENRHFSIDEITEFANYLFWITERKENDFHPVYYSGDVTKLTGYSSNELLSKKTLWLRIIHPHSRKRILEILKELIINPSKNFTEFKFQGVKKDGSLVWFHEKIKVNRDDNGKVIKIFAILTDITELMEENEKVILENKQLKENNEAKDRFISIISHDLRSPFSSILGFTKLILEQNPPKAKVTEYVNYIQNSAKSMLELVNALLDWTRLQTGRIKIKFTKVRLEDIVRNSIDMIMGTAIQKGIKVENKVPKNLYIHGDKNLLSQVFNNLLGNAVKFTKAGDVISVFAKITDDEKFIKVYVKDTGVGIKKEDLGKLFKVDSKFTNLGTAGEKGTGLGLSLVYEIVKKHGGEIEVKSKYGEGTEFIFSLPVSSSIILLIDKIPAELVLYSKLIKSLFPEFEIVTATNLEEVEKAVNEKLPVLLISEIEANDYNVFSYKKNLEKKQIQTEIIILSRNLSETSKNKLEKIGITTVFEKPVDLNSFRKAIGKLLK